MRKITEKVAVVAQISIALVFAVTAMLYLFNALPNSAAAENGMFGTLIAILAVVFAALSAYIVYFNFSENEALKQVLLHCDSESATHADAKVVKKLVKSCAKKADGIRVKKIKLRLNEQNGLIADLKVDVSRGVTDSVDVLRCLLTDAFENALGLTLASVNFEIRRLKSGYKPNVEKAEKLAKTLTRQRELSADAYEQPFENSCDNCDLAKEGETGDENAPSETPRE